MARDRKQGRVAPLRVGWYKCYMSVHRRLGVLSLLAGALVAPVEGQGRVPPALRPSPTPTVIPRRLAFSDSVMAASAAVQGQLKAMQLTDRAVSPIPGVVFAGDASLERRGLGGPTLNGFAALVPLTTLLGHLTPFVSGGLVGRRWNLAQQPVAAGDSAGALPNVLERRALADQLVDNEFSRFFGVGVAAQAGPLGISTEIRHVRTRRVDGVEGVIRGQLPVRLPF